MDNERDAFYPKNGVTPKERKMITQRSIKNDKSMPRTKIEAFLKEFPWVQTLLNEHRKLWKNPISQVYVSVVEPSLWDYFPMRYFIPGDLIDDPILYQEWMFLLDEKYDPIMYEKKIELRKKFLFFGSRAVKSQICPAIITDSRFSFGSFIMKNFGNEGQPKIDAIRFILSYYSYTKTVIIYKLPRGISISALMEEAERKEREKFRSEINF